MVFMVFVFVMFMNGCAARPSTLGDGRVDAVEAGTIRVAVGAAMMAAPETIAPAYAVSTALLLAIDSGDVVALSGLSEKVDSAMAGLELTEAEKAGANDLIALVRAKIREELGLTEITEAQRLIVVRTVLEIVRSAAAARLGVGATTERPDLKTGIGVVGVDWDQFDRDVDQAIEQAASQVDILMDIDLFKIKLSAEVALLRDEFEQTMVAREFYSRIENDLSAVQAIWP